jgi:hypothetical protein
MASSETKIQAFVHSIDQGNLASIVHGALRVFSAALSKRGNLTDPVFATDKLIAGVRDW